MGYSPYGEKTMNCKRTARLLTTLISGGACLGFVAAGCQALPTAPESSAKLWISSGYPSYETWAVWRDEQPKGPMPAGPLTLARLQEEALASSPVLQQRLEQARQSEARMRQAYSAWFPTADLAANASVNDSDVDTVAKRLTTTAYGPQASISWLLFDGGVRSATGRAALLETLAANQRYNQTFQDIVLEVHVAYYDLHSAQAAIAANETNLATAAMTLEAASAKESGGLGTPLDRLRAQTDYEQARSALENARTAVATAQSRLAFAIGWPVSTPLVLAPPETKLPEESDWPEERVAGLMEQAISQRPDVAAARLFANSAEQNLRAAKAEWLPKLTGGLQANQTENRYSDAAIENSDATEYSGQLVLAFNLFDGRLTVHRIRAAQEVCNEARQRVREVELAAGQKVWNSYYALRSAIRKLGFSRAASEAAQQAFEMADERYRAGLCDIVFLLDVQNSLSSVRRALIAAENDVWVAHVHLIHATGTLGLEEK